MADKKENNQTEEKKPEVKQEAQVETSKTEAKLEAKVEKPVAKADKVEETKKTEENKNLEREYVIPLRREFNKVPRYKKTNKAIKTIKKFIARHMKVSERDLKLVRLDKYLNEFVWSRGIKKPPAKVKVKAVKDAEGIVRVELLDMPEVLKFKKEKIERRDKKAEEKKKKKPVKKEEKPSEITQEKKEDESEKKSSIVEAGQKEGKAAAKRAKHQTKVSKQPKHQQRKALAK